jgi:L-amino acid N-acyltransferase
MQIRDAVLSDFDEITAIYNIGTELLTELIMRARAQGKHVMIAGVDSENTASLRFLERFGFERTAHLREVGYKFDRFLDLVFLQYWVTPPSTLASF